MRGVKAEVSFGDIKYKTLKNTEIEKHSIGLLNLIDPERKRQSDIIKSLTNSSIIIVAFYGNKIIGSNQVITDTYFSANIINLIVAPEYRKLGVASSILDKTLNEIKKMKIKNTILVADPLNPWLTKFYSKFGFKEGNKNGTYMYLK